MACDTNAFWGSSEVDAFRCHTPPALDLLNNPPSWDGLFDFKESIDSSSSLDLLQQPLPCSCEPPDEWLLEFERLQEVHNRAPALRGPPIPAPPHHHAPYTFAAGKSASNAGSGGSPYQTGEGQPAPLLRHYPEPFPEPEGRAIVQGGESNYSIPTPTAYMREIDSQNSGCPGPVMYSPMLYDWNPTPAFDNQPTPDGRDVENGHAGAEGDGTELPSRHEAANDPGRAEPSRVTLPPPRCRRVPYWRHSRPPIGIALSSPDSQASRTRLNIMPRLVYLDTPTAFNAICCIAEQ
ncbi:hypothetical protein ONZ43_g7618 [Nemania bipapillata]|uniref:Uncharacterized protein n=1 Tax=Nemania bipapillata TaxID=110536 RepID=A0ACC2HPK8_9PEZI|nr:hypothetical protein ONZ43_g7618 [Nemania bipapillata]